jgi:hypothetical protein
VQEEDEEDDDEDGGGVRLQPLTPAGRAVDPGARQAPSDASSARSEAGSSSGGLLGFPPRDDEEAATEEAAGQREAGWRGWRRRVLPRLPTAFGCCGSACALVAFALGVVILVLWARAGREAARGVVLEDGRLLGPFGVEGEYARYGE